MMEELSAEQFTELMLFFQLEMEEREEHEGQAAENRETALKDWFEHKRQSWPK